MSPGASPLACHGQDQAFTRSQRQPAIHVIVARHPATRAHDMQQASPSAPPGAKEQQRWLASEPTRSPCASERCVSAGLELLERQRGRKSSACALRDGDVR